VSRVRVRTVHYRAWNGTARAAYVILPAQWGPEHNPPLPLVISPHGRGVPAATNVKLWGELAADGPFAVINPDGHGRVLPLHSWGYRRQIDDLARMEQIAKATLPWFRTRPHSVYCFGGSMGGQETLLLVAQHPSLLAGAAAFDSACDMPRRYRDFARLGRGLQELCREEVGGTPETNVVGYALRSPIAYGRRIAFSGVPLQIWWSVNDQVVRDQEHESGALYRRIKELNPKAPVRAVVGTWSHSAEMTAKTRLPEALRTFGLLRPEV
jgi:pimeloyl-ACP methyl ester carboxylesterase